MHISLIEIGRDFSFTFSYARSGPGLVREGLSNLGRGSDVGNGVLYFRS